MTKRAIPPRYELTLAVPAGPALAIAALAFDAGSAIAQSGIEPLNDLPNPYQSTDGHLRMPIGRDWAAPEPVRCGRSFPIRPIRDI